MEFQTVGKFTLNQKGLYTARTQFRYIGINGEPSGISHQTGDEEFNQTYTIDPGDLGVPNGAIVTYFLHVELGDNEIAEESFIYDSGNTAIAVYMCNGKAHDEGKLHFQGVTD